MNERLNRRRLTQTAVAAAGVAADAHVVPALAQEATPPATPVSQAMVDEIVNAWPDMPKEVANTVMQKDGPPHEATPSRLIWFSNGPWKHTILFRDVVPHDFPMPHMDLLEQAIDYRVPPDMYDELANYDGSVIVERTKGEISARCDKEEMNFLAINLAHDVATGKRDVDGARDAYAKTAIAFKNGQSDPIVEGFLFDVPTGGTRDPDEPAEMEG